MISLPYSRCPSSRWYGHRVCDIKVVVEGQCCWSEKVQTALGGLDNFTTTCPDQLYDGDTESVINTDGNLSDNTYDFIPETNVDSDATPLKLTQPCCDNSDTDSDATPLINTAELIRQLTPLRRLPTKQPQCWESDTDSDATPIINTAELIRRITTADLSSDTTPIVPVTFGRRRHQRKKQPKRLFTCTN